MKAIYKYPAKIDVDIQKRTLIKKSLIMTKEDFIKKYIYGIGNDALTDNQEAIDMAKDLDKYVTEQLRQYNVVGQSEQLSCGGNITTCVFYKEGGKCSNLDYCKDQTT